MNGCVKALTRVMLGSALILGAALPVLAEGEVRLKSRVVLRLAGDARMSAEERAQIVQRQVDAALQSHLPAGRLRAVSIKGGIVLAWGEQRLCTVDGLQAKANNTTVKALAAAWLRNFREAMKDGYLSVSPQRVVIPVGEARRVRVSGVAEGPIESAVDGRGLEVSPADDALTLRASAPGTFRVTLTREGSSVSFPVIVKEWAGYVPDQVHCAVTGNPAGRALLELAALQAARRAVQAKPGATVTLKAGPAALAILGVGADATIRMPLLIEGKDYFPVDKTLEVILHNENVSVAQPTQLMVSNRPEKVDTDGILFAGKVNSNQPARLLYSHLNGNGRDQYLWVNLTNRGDRPVKVLVIQGDGGPAREELYVGHRCNTRFLEDWQARQGLIVTIPPMKAWELGRYELAPRELVSGLCHLQVLEGESLDVSVETSASGVGVAMDRLIDAPFNPFRIHPRGIFRDPNIVVDQKYVVGETTEFNIPFGRAPWLIDGTSGEPNTGNYGVLYEVKLEVSNPTLQPRKVQLFFEPINGVALGSFLVEGKLMETNCLKPPARGLISTVDVAPGQNRTIRILTLPQAGSHYPARIVVESPIQETHRESGGT
ncbi:MAG: hypothetical protein FJX76_11865 [Armatimonadetes bacterium]|nr:hypothetical protein [Armatimonadota bacterium]